MADAGREVLASYRATAPCGALRDAVDLLLFAADLVIAAADDVAKNARGALADHGYRWAIAAIEARQSAKDLLRVLCGGP